MNKHLGHSHEVLGLTQSICPVCLKVIEAKKIADGFRVYLEKKCEKHGSFRTLIWDGDDQLNYADWDVPRVSSTPPNPITENNKGCPFDCGLCPQHANYTCCVMLEVTQRCNLSCPVCFASADAFLPSSDPGLEQISSWFNTLMQSGGPFNIQLSGGEPTLRDDLPDIIRLGRERGFSFFQINSNGIRLALDEKYVQCLSDAGLNCVALQFDGITDAPYIALRGRSLLKLKQQAIENCAAASLAVILVPTLVPNINDDQIGGILEYALENLPVVRGVLFQPVSHFGRYIGLPEERLTIPSLLRRIEQQTGGRMKAGQFSPAGGENPYCGFNGNFVLMPDNIVLPWRPQKKSCCASTQGTCCSSPQPIGEGAEKARKFVAKQWQGVAVPKSKHENTVEERVYSMDEYIERIASHTLAVSCMTFQDAWTLDLERLKECYLHVVSPDNRIIPFCAYNLTSSEGETLYRGKCR